MSVDMEKLSPEVAEYIKALEKKIQEQDEKNSNLTELIIKNQKKMFGKSSEQIQYIDGAERLSLFNEAEQEYYFNMVFILLLVATGSLGGYLIYIKMPFVFE